VERRTLLKIAGAAPAAVAFANVAAQVEAFASELGVNYGSGYLSGWSNLQRVSYGSFNTADVGMFGDSITVGGWSTLNDLIRGMGKTLAVNAQSGRPTTPAVDILETWLKAGNKVPKVLLFAKGSNDIFNPVAIAGQIARVKALLKQYSPDTRLLWVNTYVDRWSQTTSVRIADNRNSGWINDQIRTLIGADVINWSQDITIRPGRDKMYLRDGLHPIAGAGYSHWAAVLLPQIKAALA
jgi:hypothetical protein